jgi:hypothetical protein
MPRDIQANAFISEDGFYSIPWAVTKPALKASFPPRDPVGFHGSASVNLGWMQPEFDNDLPADV